MKPVFRIILFPNSSASSNIAIISYGALFVQARDYMLYLSLLDVLNRNDQIPLEAYSELSLLFRHHEDLLAELSKFRPLPCPNNIYTHGSIWMIIFLMPFLLLSLVLAFEKLLKCFLVQ